MTTIDTSTAATATAYSSQRKIAQTAAGRLWVALHNGTDTEFWYSDDDGATFSQNASASVTGALDGSLFIDADGHAHFAYSKTGDIVAYRRMASIGVATSWGSEQTVDAGSQGAFAPDVVAHSEGAGWAAHITFSRNRFLGGSSYSLTAEYCRVSISSAGVVSLGSVSSISASYANSTATLESWPSVDFHHTGDGKTVSGSTPHLFAAWSTGATGSGNGIRFKKATYSAGTWTWGTEREIDSTSYANSGVISSIFDGSRTVIAYGDSGSTSTIKVRERDAADTTTTTRTPTALSDGEVTALSVSYDGDADIHLWAVGTTSDDVKRIEYDRSAGTWDGSWTSVAAADVLADTLSLKRGYTGNTIDAVYTTGTGSPYNVDFASYAINQAPTAATWDVTNNQAHDVAASLNLDWTFNDPDSGDTQGSYALRKQEGAGSYEYWNAGTSSWGASEVQNTSSTTSVTLSASWGADGDSNHKYAVKTWDAAGLEGTYSSELTVIPSAKDNPTISSPAASGTVTTSSLTVTWSATTQTAYKARLLSSGGAELESSGWVTSTSTSHTFAYTLVSSTSYQVELTTKNDEGLASTADTNSFSTSFTPPSTPTITVTASAANGYVTVAVTNPGAGATESHNDIYVRVATGGRADIDRPVGGDGIRVATGVAVDGSWIDYAVASGVDYEYLARVTATNGVTADSAWT